MKFSALMIFGLIATNAMARPVQTPEEMAQECKDYGRCAAVEYVKPVVSPEAQADDCKHYGACGDKPAERYLPDAQTTEEIQSHGDEEL